MAELAEQRRLQPGIEAAMDALGLRCILYNFGLNSSHKYNVACRKLRAKIFIASASATAGFVPCEIEEEVVSLGEARQQIIEVAFEQHIEYLDRKRAEWNNPKQSLDRMKKVSFASAAHGSIPG